MIMDLSKTKEILQMKTIHFYRCKQFITHLLLISFLAIAGCGGDDGATGPQGPAGAAGPTGETGETGASGSSATRIITATMSSTITNANVADDGTVTVEFNVNDEHGYGFTGLTTSNIRFTLATLLPAGTTGIGDSTQWQSYINKTESAPTDPDKGTGTEDTVHATYERSGELTDNEDGTYSYIFEANVKNATSPVAVDYNQEYTHRIAFQISGGGFPVMNRSYDWQPSTGAITGITSREMVMEGSCNQCHGELALHGGGRVDTAYCVTCHNPGTTDANSGHNLDFKVMVHKIHRGKNLPSVQNGDEYAIWGYRDSKHDYSGTSLPMDIRNCTACHDDTASETPDAINWVTAPTIESCGSCHDDIDFSKGADDVNGHPGGAVADNGECALCHGEGRFASTRAKHMGVMEDKQEMRVRAVVNPIATRIDQVTGDIEVDVMFTIDGAPVVALRDNNDVDTDEGAVLGKYKYGTDNGALAINWDNGTGYQVNHQEVDFNDCTPDGNGLFTCAASGLVAGISDSDTVTLTTVDLFLCMNEKDGEIIQCDAAESDSVKVNQVEVTPTTAYFNGDGTVSTGGYDKIGANIANCQSCHRDNHFHHGATELGQCKTCHNATRASSRGRPGDLKHHVHRFHAGIDNDAITPTEAGDVEEYPNTIANCQACHDGSMNGELAQIDLPVQKNNRASAANRDAPVFISPTAVVCASCHVDAALGLIDPDKPGYMDNSAISPFQQAVLDHMIQNGAVFAGQTFEEANKVESCAVCHAIGSEMGVDNVHQSNSSAH